MIQDRIFPKVITKMLNPGPTHKSRSGRNYIRVKFFLFWKFFAFLSRFLLKPQALDQIKARLRLLLILRSHLIDGLDQAPRDLNRLRRMLGDGRSASFIATVERLLQT